MRSRLIACTTARLLAGALFGCALFGCSSGSLTADGGPQVDTPATDAPAIDAPATDAPAIDAPIVSCNLPDAGPPPFSPPANVPTSATCGTHDRLGVQMFSATEGAASGATYDGPAIIERSTTSELVIWHQPAGSATALHTIVYALGPVPILPVGARVWLTTDHAYAFSVRERQDGRLLFGSVREVTALNWSPIPLGEVRATCSTASPYPCVTGANVVYSTVDVRGDTVVPIYDSETKIVPICGVDYDVRITAQYESGGTLGQGCTDYYPARGISIEFSAHDLASLVATLERGPAPACAEGNDEYTYADLFVFDGINDGAVFYRARTGNAPPCYEFDRVAGGSGTAIGAVHVCADASVFAAPTPGQEFWVTKAGGVTALREAQRGPLILARGDAAVPFPPETTSGAMQALGVGVDSDPRCSYSSGISLWDVVFATSPATRVPSMTVTPVRIGGRDYKAWSWAKAGTNERIWFVVYR